MTIVGEYPESGVRVEVERPVTGGPPWRYHGEAVTPTARFSLHLLAQEDGSVTVELADGAPPELSEKTRLMLRAVCRHAVKDDAVPPRRIVRWRPNR
jgi:hypothetical protein